MSSADGMEARTSVRASMTSLLGARYQACAQTFTAVTFAEVVAWVGATELNEPLAEVAVHVDDVAVILAK